MNNLKISIITVCYNSEDLIEETVKSVLQQTYENLEYVVVDGNSKDSTMDILSQYEEKISVLVSEPDKGIFDAMNKGIDLCTGDWCLFLNSGDYLYSEDSIRKAVALFDESADVIYGDTEYRFDYGKEVFPPLPLEKVMDGAFCCHQSTFFKTGTLRNYKYDLSYRIVADWVLLRTMYLDKCKFHYINTIVSSYDNTVGASTASSIKSYIKHETEKARCKGIDRSILWKVKMWCGAFTFYTRRKLSSLIPNSLYNKLKKIWIHIHR